MRLRRYSLLWLALLLVSGATINAYEFSFVPYADAPLFPQSKTDPFSTESKLNFISLLEGQPRTIRVASSGTYEDVDIYNPDAYSSETLYGQLKTGVSLGLLRLGIEGLVQAEFAFQGGLNSVFQGFGGADLLGFDGTFFMGTSVRLLDSVTVRYGLQHYSGHYGDETLVNVREHSGSTDTPIEYCRDNNILAGISLDVGSVLRLYADASRPKGESWMNPAIHIPSWVLKATSGQPLYIDGANKEGISPEEHPEDYKAWIIQAGAELSVPLGFAELFLAGEVKFHQDGQTLHMPGEYDPENPWEREFTVGGGLAFAQSGGMGDARIEVYYHDGRFPLLNYFYQRSKYISIGFAVGE